MLYNTSEQVWKDAKSHYEESRKTINVVDGHVHVAGDGWVARFEDQESAMKCLKNAGYAIGQTGRIIWE